MITQKIGYDVLNLGVTMLGYKKEIKPAVLNMKDGSRMTTTAYIFTTPEGIIFINPGKQSISYRFENKEEFESQEKFEFHDNEKELWQSFTGMDDETWEEWNK